MRAVKPPLASKPVLPPSSGRASASPVQVEATPRTGGSWFLPLVGLALSVVLLGVGVKLMGSSTNEKNTSTAQPQGTETPVPPQTPAPVAVEKEPASPPASERPNSAISATPTPVTEEKEGDGMDGIVSIPLDRAESYLPYPRTRYRHSIEYPDGDSGHREMVVASSRDGKILTVLEFTYSKMFPDDPPGLWINHYVNRPDGVYRYSDEEPYRAELWLPNDLKLGKKWKSELGEFEVVAFDQSMTVNGTAFEGVLAYRQRNPAVGLDQTIWIATGYGEIQGRWGENGSEMMRLLRVDSESESQIDQLMKRHVVNLDKIK